MLQVAWNYPIVSPRTKEDPIKIYNDIARGRIVSVKHTGFLDIIRTLRNQNIHAHGRGFPFPELSAFFAKKAIYTPFNDKLGQKWWTRFIRRKIFNRLSKARDEWIFLEISKK